MNAEDRTAVARVVDELDEMTSRVSALETELHAVKYEVMGGEDVPGSASAVTVDAVRKEMARLRTIERRAEEDAETRTPIMPQLSVSQINDHLGLLTELLRHVTDIMVIDQRVQQDLAERVKRLENLAECVKSPTLPELPNV